MSQRIPNKQYVYWKHDHTGDRRTWHFAKILLQDKVVRKGYIQAQWAPDQKCHEGYEEGGALWSYLYPKNIYYDIEGKNEVVFE